MSIKIRLARGGRSKSPFYRVVVSDSRSPRDGKFIEKIGTYDPLLSENRVNINKDRATYWISVGAVPSQRVAGFLCDLGVKDTDKYKPKFIAKKKGDGAKKKALEAMAAAEEKVRQAEETKAEETKAEETKAEETKAEETKAEETKAEETKADNKSS